MMLKNNIKTMLLAVVPLLFGAGCSKGFLEIQPQGQLTATQALQDPNAADQLVGGVYNTLYFGGFGNTTVGFEWSILSDVASDDGDKGSTPSDFNTNGAGDIDNFVADPKNGIFNNVWNGHFLGIARANNAIKLLTNSTFDAATKNRLLAEVRFLRGLYYFNLVRAFGGVPKVITSPEPSEVNGPEF